MIENQCSICLEIFKEEIFYKTMCKHKFHIECAYKWLKQNHSCPLCRKYTFFKEIMDIKISHNFDYQLIQNYNFKKLYIKPFIYEENIYDNIYIQLKEQSPCAWINILEAHNIAPLYILFSSDHKKHIYIDYHLRQLLLWEDKIVHYYIKKEIDLKTKKFYLTSQQPLFYNKNIYEKNENVVTKKTCDIIVDWIYDVMISIKYTSHYDNFIYHKSMNTLILDLTLCTIQYQNLPLKLFQTAIICSIYLVLKLYYKDVLNQISNGEKTKKEIISIEKCIELTDYSSKLEDVEPILEFQNKFLSKYIKFTQNRFL